MNGSNKKLYLVTIAGPTAAGKSEIAIKIAEKLKAIVINADAMQVYADLKIITARPVLTKKQPKHLLFGHVGANEKYSVAKWLQQIHDILEQNVQKNNNVIIVGGTGLYFKCFFDGIASLPNITKQTEEQIKHIIQNKGKEYIFQLLHEYDPKICTSIQINDYRRAKKALAIVMQTGKSIEYWQKNYHHSFDDKIKNQYQYIPIFLNPDRELLYKNINRRIDKIFDDEVIEEVNKLLLMKIPQNATILQAIGIKHIKQYIEKNIALDDAIKKTQRDNRRYAKRQYTWARKYMQKWKWIKQDEYDSIFSLFE